MKNSQSNKLQTPNIQYESSTKILNQEIKKLEEKHGSTKQYHNNGMSNSVSKMGYACIELCAPVLVGGYLGHFVDNLLDFRCICMILGMLVGVCTGWVNIIRMYKRI